ncbi:hypothetical protein [Halostagnicola kamekurae]|uniref:Uncharacterized protein n=1 Tax=Halostagnicola kamekurae TaxID=619731 RepID=A0A1I6USX6_9EURY|nr:hypothetical protein [Halostagnicola kamekurae]SFT04531.1 hypothetical protein SAMN04488556_4065 [Halostagnicola kamekurae]
MLEQFSLKELYQYTFATNERIAKKESGLGPDEQPTEFTAFYHRDQGGVEKDILVQEVNEIIEDQNGPHSLKTDSSKLHTFSKARIPFLLAKPRTGKSSSL